MFIYMDMLFNFSEYFQKPCCQNILQQQWLLPEEEPDSSHCPRTSLLFPEVSCGLGMLPENDCKACLPLLKLMQQLISINLDIKGEINCL
jgi:hypothetical protein